MSKFKVGDRVIFNHTDTQTRHEWRGKKAIILSLQPKRAFSVGVVKVIGLVPELAVHSWDALDLDNMYLIQEALGIKDV